MTDYKYLPEWAQEIADRCTDPYDAYPPNDDIDKLLQAYDEALGEIERLEKIAAEHSWCNSEERMGR